MLCPTPHAKCGNILALQLRLLYINLSGAGIVWLSLALICNLSWAGAEMGSIGCPPKGITFEVSLTVWCCLCHFQLVVASWPMTRAELCFKCLWHWSELLCPLFAMTRVFVHSSSWYSIGSIGVWRIDSFDSTSSCSCPAENWDGLVRLLLRVVPPSTVLCDVHSDAHRHLAGDLHPIWPLEGFSLRHPSQESQLIWQISRFWKIPCSVHGLFITANFKDSVLEFIKRWQGNSPLW